MREEWENKERGPPSFISREEEPIVFFQDDNTQWEMHAKIEEVCCMFIKEKQVQMF